MQAREAARVLGRERQAVLVAVDGLVLCAVVAEHALDLRHAPDEPDIEDEHGNAQHAVDDVPQKRVAVVLAHDEVRDEGGRHDEEHNAERKPANHRDGHLLLAELGLGLLRTWDIVSVLAICDRLRGVALGFSHHLKRALRAECLNHGVGAAEIVLPGEFRIGFLTRGLLGGDFMLRPLLAGGLARSSRHRLFFRLLFPLVLFRIGVKGRNL